MVKGEMDLVPPARRVGITMDQLLLHLGVNYTASGALD
jgi:hypothetical protein